MRLVSCLILLALTIAHEHAPMSMVEGLNDQKSLAKYGTYGKDFQYYRKDGIDDVIHENHGVNM